MPTDNETARRAMHRSTENVRPGTNRISAHFDHGKWRRLSGITCGIERHLDPAERRAHIRRIAAWIEARVKAEIGNRESEIRNWSPATDDRPPIGCTTDWLPELEQWECVAHAGITAEAICEELGIARQTLTRLLREYCALSLGEFLDGLKLRRLKHELLPQLRLAARVLWGRPGAQAELLAAGEHPTHTWSLPKKGSKFFQPQPEDWRELNAWRKDTSARTGALLAKLSELRRGGCRDECLNFGADVNALDMQIVAARLAFDTPQKLNQACVRVFGRSLGQIERVLASEIVRYYIAAEDRVLREAACSTNDSAYTARARYLYHGDDDHAPTEPFLDAWSAAEAFQKDWLDAMSDAFG